MAEIWNPHPSLHLREPWGGWCPTAMVLSAGLLVSHTISGEEVLPRALPALCLKGPSAQHGRCPWVWPGLGPPAATPSLPEKVKGGWRARPGQHQGWLWGRHVAAWPGHTYAGTTWLWPWAGQPGGDPRAALSSLLEELGGSQQPTFPLVQPVGRGGLQPHPGRPLHTVSYLGPATDTQGLAGS